jgi:diguanylate cyclase (GGDEF)-like protein/PAS domain S-box-containing protein
VLLGAVCIMHDVTELRAAEATARLEAERFSDAFASAAQGMALVSLDGHWLEVNDAVCEMFGYTRAELLERDFQQLTHPEDRGADLQLVGELLLGKRKRYQMEKRYFHRTGRVIHAHLAVSLVRDLHGRPLHFVSQIQDFTQRYHAERRLRESEQKFRAVLQHSQDAFVAAGEDGRIIEWNHAAEVTFGWRREEVLGRPLDEVVVPPRMRAAHREGMSRFVRTGESRVLDQRLQLPGWHRSGVEFPVEMTISRVHIGDRQVFSAFMHDITARMRDKEALRASAEQLRTIADNVPALIAHVGPDLRFRFVNRSYAAWFGTEAEALVGRGMGEVLRPEHFKALQPRLAAVLAGETVAFEMDVRDINGAVRHMRATYVPVPSSVSAPDTGGGFHLMVHDQTAQVRLARMLSAQALRDELTGLPNRAAWNDELDRAVARARRAQRPLAVMFLDLNGLKAVNDRHGHAAGDHVLRAFADGLRRSLRAGDFVARLAGDEFVVLLDGVGEGIDGATRVAEKVIATLLPGTTFEGQALPIEPSIGIAIQPGPRYDREALVRSADEAMYAAKRDAASRISVSVLA